MRKYYYRVSTNLENRENLEKSGKFKMVRENLEKSGNYTKNWESQGNL